MANQKQRMFTSSDLQRRCFNCLIEMRNQKELCDVTFKIGNESVSAHRVIIAAVIPYFRDLWSSNNVESEEDVSMRETEPYAFKCLIEFAYTCQVEINEENVGNLLAAACYLGLVEVREACCDFLADSLEPENVLNVRVLADNLNCSELVKYIDDYIAQNFSEISQSSDFLNYPLTYVKQQLSRDDLIVDSEENVFDAVLKWVKNYPENRKNELPELMCKIRMPLLSPFFLAKIIGREELIRESMLCRDLIEEARNYNPYPELRKSICSFVTEPRQSLKTVDVRRESDNRLLYKLNARLQYTVQRFDITEGKWDTRECHTYAVKSGSAAECRNKMYFFNWGYAIQYDPGNNEYRFLKEVPIPRRFMGTASLGNKIYVCGGKINSTDVTNAVDCFDPEKNNWIRISFMRTGRWGPSAVALGEYVFVLGGRDNSSIFDCVERYDPHTDKWRTMSPMLIKRCFAGATALNGHIYICGGQPQLQRVACATAEIYDPVINRWKFISEMNSPRAEFTLLSCFGKLHAVGGRDRNWKLVHTFQIYDPETDEWTSGPSTDADYLASGCVSMSALCM